MREIVLATTSPYKIQLFSQLGFEFQAQAPLFDESSYKNMNLPPLELAQFLAFEKANSLKEQFPQALIIGADQVLCLEKMILGKPLNFESNVSQLKMLSGKKHLLLTAVSLTFSKKTVHFCDSTELQMRKLKESEINHYVEFEKAFDCAGGYKIESRGISLFEHISSNDFTAIQGLPLLELNKQLRTLML